MKVSLISIIGVLFSIVLILSSIALSTDEYSVFLSLASALLVFGGVFASTLMSFEGSLVFKSIKEVLSVMLAFKVNNDTLKADAEFLTNCSASIRKNGIKKFEDELNDGSHDPFVLDGLDLVLKGYSDYDLKYLLNSINDKERDEHLKRKGIIEYMANVAPAFGMIGTLVGLVIMLSNLNGDAADLGQGLALALVTTLYGVILQQALKPAAAKADLNSKLIYERRKILIDAFVLIADNKPKMMIQDSFNTKLERQHRIE